jgi:sugar lactone lactonase YvrE
LGEGPLWSQSEQALYWLDIGNRKLFRQQPASSHAESWALAHYPGCIAELTAGNVAVAMGEGIRALNLRTGATQPLGATPTRPSGTRFNDGKVDPLGRLWVGTMQNNFGPNGESVPVERSDGALYCFDADGSVHTIEENVGIANTLAWSPDRRTFYFADSLRGQLYAYDFDAALGTVRNKRVFFEASDLGVPDGSAMDTDGCLWNARWDAGVIVRITPAGVVDRSIALPGPRPTSCAFGGPSLDTLYVTSAQIGLSAQQLGRWPLSGAVFAIEGVARGVPVPRYVHTCTN